MSEAVRYVTLDAGGRPSTVLDLDDMVRLFLVRESFAYNEPVKQPIVSTANRRYGGKRQTGETTDNGAITGKILVAGATADECIRLVEQLLTQLAANPSASTGLLVEWQPDGTSFPSYYEVRGTGVWKCTYEWAQFVGTQSMIFEVTIPCAPLASGLPYDIEDVFAVDTRTDYTYLAGAPANEEHVTGALEAVANVNSETRAAHTARGYDYADNQQTLLVYPGATITGFKAGVLLKSLTARTYLVAYLEDNGTHTVLKIDKIIEGVATTLSSVNLGTRLEAGKPYWCRGRIEGNVATAECFGHITTAPTPMGAPYATCTHTLTAGAEQETFGHLVEGTPGRMWVPMTVGARVAEYTVEPFTYRNVTLPETLALAGVIAGDAPALVDVTVTPSGGAAAPIAAILGWSAAPVPAFESIPAPFGIFPSTQASEAEGWENTANAKALGGSLLADATSSAATDYAAQWAVDPSAMTPDDFTNEIAIEVWARALLSSTLVTPTIVLTAQPEDGLAYGSARPTDEWGQMGKQLTVPEGGSRFRFVKLGTLRMRVDPARPRVWIVNAEGLLGAGSSGEWGINYLIMLPATTRASSPSSQPNDSGYPQFITSTAETSKTIRHDLSALIVKPPGWGHPDHGLGGEVLEMPPGLVQLLVKLSSLAPDDPTIDETTEQTTHAATVHLAVRPRWQMFRSD